MTRRMRDLAVVVVLCATVCSVARGQVNIDRRLQYIWGRLHRTKDAKEVDELLNELAGFARDKNLPLEKRVHAGTIVGHWLAGGRGKKYRTPERVELAEKVSNEAIAEVGPHPERTLKSDQLRHFLACYLDLAILKVESAGERGLAACEAILASQCDAPYKLVAYVTKAQTLVVMERYQEAADAYDEYRTALQGVIGNKKYAKVKDLIHPTDIASTYVTPAYVRAGRPKGAVQLGMTALRVSDTEYMIRYVGSIVGALGADPETIEPLLGEMAVRLDASAPAFDEILAIYSKCLMTRGRSDQALAAAKLRYNVCPLSEVNAAIESVGSCLRAADLDVERMTQFVNFQQFGAEGADGKVGTPDDLKDPLAAVNAKLPADVEKALRAKLDEPLTARHDAQLYQALKDRGSLHLALGEYPQTLRYYKSAYNVATMARTREASALIPRALKAMDGNLIRANAYLNYQKYGPAGKDGKAGTEDDLKDPTPKIDAKLPASVVQALRGGLAGRKTGPAAVQYRGFCHLAIEEYQEAAGQFRILFVNSGNDQRSLLNAINSLAALIKAWDGHLCRANQYLLYQKHGSAGPEGKPGSLENPLKDVLKEIQSANR